MKLSVVTNSGESTGRQVGLSKDVFGVAPHQHILWLDVRRILQNQRQGTHKAKEKGEITGSTRKLRKQKGSGNARVGSIKSPLFRGGGRIFGPRPRNYSLKLNKKEQVLARKSALSVKASEKNIQIVEQLVLGTPSTKEVRAILAALGVAGRKVLFVIPESDKNLVLASRNLDKVRVLTAAQLNTYDILHADQLLVSESALPIVEEVLKK